MLFFLSKGYFASGNCRKEIAATLKNENPIILLHETDPDRGGIPISQVYDESDVAGERWCDQIFVPRRPVIPYLRVKDFKIISLKKIVSSLLQHQSNVEAKLTSETFDNSDATSDSSLGSDLYLPGEVMRERLIPNPSLNPNPNPNPNQVMREKLSFSPGQTALIVSDENPGAKLLAQVINLALAL